ncbi:5-formyltetrahydrofolate cyclo-ligase [Thermovibrio sp.]
MLTKEGIRRELLKKRLSLSKEESEKRSSAIRKKLEEEIRKLEPRSLLLFYPIKGEPNLLPLVEKLIEKGKEVSFPKVVGKEIVPFKVSSLKELSRGKFGIPEPPPFKERRVREVDLVIVPGIAFDERGYRIGYGGGFYDRLLEKLPVKSKIGVCFDFQLLSKIPNQPFDIPVDVVITEKRVRRK